MLKGFGFKPQKQDPRDLKFSLASPPKQLPTKVDLRESGFMPQVYDQGQLGSCTANAIASALEFEMRKKGAGYFTPSRIFIYYNERMMEGDISEDNGAEIRDGIKSCNIYGIIPESELPYDISKFADQPSEQCYMDAKQDRIKYYAAVDLTDINHIKLALAHGNPIVFGMRLKAADFQNYKSGLLPVPKINSIDELEGHAVKGCGYDDSIGGVLIKNSWGPLYGMAGYFWLPYEYITNSMLAMDGWVIRL